MNFFRKNPPLNQRSQIAVIITFVIVVIILFTAVFINISKVSQGKTTTSTVADRAALSLASQLGSMSHYYKNTVLKISGTCGTSPCQVCGPGWLALILVAVGTVVIVPVFPAIIVAGIPAAAIISSSMLGGISDVFNKEMTLYNALREQTLFQALRSTQTDDVELTRVGAGMFRDETTGKDYSLSGIPEMRNAKKVSRFAAWYYNLRQPLVNDNYLKDALDTFKNGLKRVIVIDEWDNAKWKINKFTYFIEPGPADKGADYEITCTSSASCPVWVKNVTSKQIAIMKIDATQPGGVELSGGFLNDKLISLLNRLQDKYGNIFCDQPSCKFNPSDVQSLRDDIKTFLFRSKEVIDMPTTVALNNITQWFPFFYDSAQHNLDKSTLAGSSIDGDAYKRLIRDQNYINAFINELGTLNNNIIAPDIRKKHGECTWGRGASVSSTCYTQYGCSTPECGCHCCGSDCSDCCCNTCCYPSSKKSPCAWEGTYYTCCQNPPVCSNGDLYGTKPAWCSSHGDHASCHSNCGCSVQSFNCADNAKDFQGQLAYNNTSGPTEVEQALKILRDLNYDIDNIKKNIENFVDAQTTHFTPTEIRNKIVYAWKSKPDQTGKQYDRLVQVAIEGYPDKLPYINENIDRLGLQKCRQLENGTGDFKIKVWRYDQDQPTDIAGWNLSRRRKGPAPTGKEFSPIVLDHIVTDIQDDATISTSNEGPIKQLIYWYAIISCSQAHYGPEKSDIYITGTQCDKKDTSSL